MNQYSILKKHYKITHDEAVIIKNRQPTITTIADKFIDEFYDYIWGFG